MRPVRRVNDFMKHWWPIVVTAAGGSIIGTMLLISFVALDDAAEKEAEASQLTELVESSRRSERNREQRLGEAVGQVEQALQRQMAHHDAETDAMLDDLLIRIEHLLRRPAGIGNDPIVAQPVAPPRQPTETFRPPGGTQAAPSTTTSPSPSTSTPVTTSPRQKNCDRRPNGPHC